MDKESAINKLNELISRKNDLPKYSLQNDNQEFKKWYKDTEIALRHIFLNDGDKHVNDFLEINLTLSFFTSDTPDHIFEDKHNSGINDIESLLKSYIDEIIEYWHDDEIIKNTQNNIDLLRNSLNKFHLFARQIKIRHKKRESLIINDEYDVQDLIHALLKLYFDDVREEEYSPSYAGSGSKIDFLIEDNKIALEIKKTRKNLLDKQIGEELIIDIQRYQVHPSVKKIMCFVYDPESLLRNPKGLINDICKISTSLDTEVIINPIF